MTGSRSICISTNDPVSFLFIAEWYPIVDMNHIFLIHSSVDGHSGYFHVLAFVNSASTNIGVHVKTQDISNIGWWCRSYEVLFSCSMCPTLWPHGLQHARLPCPSPSPRACVNSCPLSRWYLPTIPSSIIPFSFCLQSFPTWGSFQMIWLIPWCGQSIGASASA